MKTFPFFLCLVLATLLITACERTMCSDVVCGENSYCNENDGLCECETAYERGPSGNCTIPKRDKFLDEYILVEDEVDSTTGVIIPNTTSTYNVEIQAGDQDVSDLTIRNLRNTGAIITGQVDDDSRVGLNFGAQPLGNELTLGVYASLDMTSGKISLSYAIKNSMGDLVYYRAVLTPQ